MTETRDVVGVRFKRRGKIYYFDPKDAAPAADAGVIVETARGVEYGYVAIERKTVEKESIVGELKPIIRTATEDDERRHGANRNLAREAMAVCEDKIREHGLKMHLINAEYTFDNSKLLFYFTADGRVDFRGLVRDLASIFRTRIELRQIGVRDEAKLVGGIGICGRECCCTTFLGDFAPVSINMAKDQGLSLNPDAISGVCGRLLCCLRYEQDGYEENLKILPRVGRAVYTSEGQGVVVSTDTLRALVKVKIETEDGVEFVVVSASDVSRKPCRGKGCAHEASEASMEEAE